MRLTPLRVVHLITDLDRGGAEIMLARLVAALDPAVVENVVVSLGSGGAIAAQMAAAGVRVESLGMRPGRLNVAGLYRLARLLRRLRPEVLQTWLYHADLAGLVAGALAGVPATVWNIRCADLDPRDHPRTLPLLLRTLAALSGRPAAVVTNSDAGRRAHDRLGYHPRRWVLVPNGFDTATFHPDPDARAAIRRELGVADDTPLVGLLARLHPMKDHGTFLRSAAQVAAARPEARFLIAGRGVVESPDLAQLITDGAGSADNDKAHSGLQTRVHLLGERSDAPRILAALDVAVSSSYSEAFPNVVGEAMACGTPAVVTDVGDSAVLVGDRTLVVPPRNPAALAAAILRVLALDRAAREALGQAARARILSEFSLERAAADYRQLYETLARANETGPIACAE